MAVMNARINALKRNVEKSEKKKQQINRERERTIQASQNKMEKSQSRVELAQRTQVETEQKR